VLNPEVAGREFLISGDIEKTLRGGPAGAAAARTPTPYSGMIVAHGNKRNGYGIYMLDDKMYFQVNQEGKSYQLSTPTAPPARFSFKAGLQKNGTMRLYIDNKEVGSAKAAGLFKKNFEVPIRVGADQQIGDERITEYPDSAFVLRSNLTNTKLETLEGITTPATSKTVKVDKVIILKVLKDVMKYDKQLITAQAGTTVQIVLQNPDFMQHNLVLIKPKTLEKVGAEADRLAQDPSGVKMQYIPKMPEVLQATPLINTGGKYTLTFKVPATPGDYPYVCTFPGHWRIMNGILRVTK
jgi:azurin